MNCSEQHVELARQFATALDACDYAEAARFLTADCRYDGRREGTCVGPDAILDSYRQSDALARRAFDSVNYRSEVDPDPSGGIRLTFFDELRHADAGHTYRCGQIVYFDAGGLIHRIKLLEFPDERQRLEAFCTSQGVVLATNN